MAVHSVEHAHLLASYKTYLLKNSIRNSALCFGTMSLSIQLSHPSPCSLQQLETPMEIGLPSSDYLAGITISTYIVL